MFSQLAAPEDRQHYKTYKNASSKKLKRLYYFFTLKNDLRWTYLDYYFAYQEGFLEHIPTKKINGPFNELKEILLS